MGPWQRCRCDETQQLLHWELHNFLLLSQDPWEWGSLGVGKSYTLVTISWMLMTFDIFLVHQKKKTFENPRQARNKWLQIRVYRVHFVEVATSTTVGSNTFAINRMNCGTRGAVIAWNQIMQGGYRISDGEQFAQAHACVRVLHVYCCVCYGFFVTGCVGLHVSTSI